MLITNNILSTLTKSKNYKKPIRRGRGTGSGSGDLCLRGSKGQKQRTSVKVGFEGGQTPFYKTIPIRGFTNSRKLKNKTLAIDINRVIEFAKEDKLLTTRKILHLTKSSFAFNKVKLIGNIKEKITNKFTVICNAASEYVTNELKKHKCNLIILNNKTKD